MRVWRVQPVVIGLENVLSRITRQGPRTKGRGLVVMVVVVVAAVLVMRFSCDKVTGWVG